MSNGAAKPNEFDATTRVMESGLLRTLTDKSSGADDNHEARATTTKEPPPPAPASSLSPATGTGQPEVAPELPARGSRLFVVAGVVTAVVLAFDASLYIAHEHRAPRPAAAAARPQPMPRYMLLPPGSSPPPMPAAAIVPPAVAPTPASTPIAATAISDAPAMATHERRHSHHRHSSH